AFSPLMPQLCRHLGLFADLGRFPPADLNLEWFGKAGVAEVHRRGDIAFGTNPFRGHLRERPPRRIEAVEVESDALADGPLPGDAAVAVNLLAFTQPVPALQHLRLVALFDSPLAGNALIPRQPA